MDLHHSAREPSDDDKAFLSEFFRQQGSKVFDQPLFTDTVARLIARLRSAQPAGVQSGNTTLSRDLDNPHTVMQHLATVYAIQIALESVATANLDAAEDVDVERVFAVVLSIIKERIAFQPRHFKIDTFNFNHELGTIVFLPLHLMYRLFIELDRAAATQGVEQQERFIQMACRAYEMTRDVETQLESEATHLLLPRLLLNWRLRGMSKEDLLKLLESPYAVNFFDVRAVNVALATVIAESNGKELDRLIRAIKMAAKVHRGPRRRLDRAQVHKSFRETRAELQPLRRELIRLRNVASAREVLKRRFPEVVRRLELAALAVEWFKPGPFCMSLDDMAAELVAAELHSRPSTIRRYARRRL